MRRGVAAGKGCCMTARTARLERPGAFPTLLVLGKAAVTVIWLFQCRRANPTSPVASQSTVSQSELIVPKDVRANKAHTLELLSYIHVSDVVYTVLSHTFPSHTKPIATPLHAHKSATHVTLPVLTLRKTPTASERSNTQVPRSNTQVRPRSLQVTKTVLLIYRPHVVGLIGSLLLLP